MQGGSTALPLPQALPVGPRGQEVIGHKLCDFPVPLPFASQGSEDEWVSSPPQKSCARDKTAHLKSSWRTVCTRLSIYGRLRQTHSRLPAAVSRLVVFPWYALWFFQNSLSCACFKFTHKKRLKIKSLKKPKSINSVIIIKCIEECWQFIRDSYPRLEVPSQPCGGWTPSLFCSFLSLLSFLSLC